MRGEAKAVIGSFGIRDDSRDCSHSEPQIFNKEGPLERRTHIALALIALLFGANSLMAQDQVAMDASLLPPNAKPGECYARVWVEPAYQTVTERVLLKPETERFEIVPARYETVSESVLLKEASTELEVVPAVYEWVEESVLVKPESKKLVEVPAVYETVTERVLVKPATTVWKKGQGPIQKIDEATGEIMCLVEVPAEYKTVTKQVLKTPATTREVVVPAEYSTVRKRVMKTPPTTREIAIPAEYNTITVTKQVQPAREIRTKVPAEYQTVTKQQQVSEGKMEWRSILCETNMSQARVLDIQHALKAAGYNPGRIDGVIGAQTIEAVNAYQRANNLPVDRYLNIETVRHLGVLD